MNADRREGPGTLPLELADRIDRVCDRYEAILAAGQRPRIEDYLGDVPESVRPILVRELLASELEWRRRLGERPTLAEYQERLAAYRSVVSGAFEDPASSADPSTLCRPPGDPRASRGVADGGATPTSGLEGGAGGSLRPGARPLPGYRLIERLGRGGFGEVWKAEAPGGVPVALKFVHLHDGHGALERRALEAIKGIRHPNLLALFGTWQVDDLLIIGMELADGTLLDRLHRARDDGQAGIPAEELIEYLSEAAKGIDHLNGHVHALDGRERVGVQHRDIKPQNILLVGGGVKVADFGLARLLDRSVTGHTGSLTPAYAAPEFFREETTDRSDQYSLAVTYCHLRGGRLPFTGGSAAMMAGHLDRPPDLTMLPEPERDVVGRALAKVPVDRWSDCRAFVAALRTTLGSDAPMWPAIPPGRKSTAPAAGLSWPDPEALPTTPPPAPRGIRGRGVVLLAVSVSLGLALWIADISPLTRFGARPTPSPGPALPNDLRAPEATGQAGRPGPPADPSAAARVPTGPSSPGRDLPGPIRWMPAPPMAFDPASAPAGRRAATPYKEQGLLRYNNGEFEEAIIAYSEALEIDRDDASAYNNRGNAYFKLGHYDAAIEDYDRAIHLDPNTSVIHFNRGNACLGMNRYQHAIDSYSRAIALDQRASNAHANRAEAREKLGDHAGAASDRARAARLESGSDATSSTP